MNSIALLDGGATLFLLAAMIYLLLNHKRLPDSRRLKTTLFLSLATFAFMTAFNFLEHSGITDKPDTLEDLSEIIFFILFIFFIYSYKTYRDINELRVRNGEGEVMGYIGNFADVGSYDSLMEQLNHLQKQEAIGQLASGVAHDLNNMLGGVMGATELMELDPEKLIVRGDSTQLQNALLNLILNARDAQPRGGLIEIRAGKRLLTREYCQDSPFPLTEGEYVDIAICDKGPEISDEVMGRVFEPFFTTKTKGKGNYPRCQRTHH